MAKTGGLYQFWPKGSATNSGVHIGPGARCNSEHNRSNEANRLSATSPAISHQSSWRDVTSFTWYACFAALNPLDRHTLTQHFGA